MKVNYDLLSKDIGGSLIKDCLTSSFVIATRHFRILFILCNLNQIDIHTMLRKYSHAEDHVVLKNKHDELSTLTDQKTEIKLSAQSDDNHDNRAVFRIIRKFFRKNT